MYAQTYHAVQGEVGVKMAVSCLVMAASVGYKDQRFERTCSVHLQGNVSMICEDTRHDFPEDSGPHIYRCAAYVSHLINFFGYKYKPHKT
jgi:hypothetical protein